MLVIEEDTAPFIYALRRGHHLVRYRRSRDKVDISELRGPVSRVQRGSEIVDIERVKVLLARTAAGVILRPLLTRNKTATGYQKSGDY